jgi:hypothetical protein
MRVLEGIKLSKEVKFGFRVLPFERSAGQSLWGGREALGFLSVFGLKGSCCWKRFIDFLGGPLTVH